MTNLMNAPMSQADAQAMMPNERLIGFKYITEPGQICTEGCLAPGSSAHSHSVVTQTLIVHERTLTWLNAEGLAVRQASLHQWPQTEPDAYGPEV